MTKLLTGDSRGIWFRNTIEKRYHKNPAILADEAAKIYEASCQVVKNADSSRSLLVARFFDPRRYDLAAVGRYKGQQKT